MSGRDPPEIATLLREMLAQQTALLQVQAESVRLQRVLVEHLLGADTPAPQPVAGASPAPAPASDIPPEDEPYRSGANHRVEAPSDSRADTSSRSASHAEDGRPPGAVEDRTAARTGVDAISASPARDNLRARMSADGASTGAAADPTAVCTAADATSTSSAQDPVVARTAQDAVAASGLQLVPTPELPQEPPPRNPEQSAARGNRYYQARPSAAVNGFAPQDLELWRRLQEMRDAGDLILQFGPYKGDTLAQVALHHPHYIRELMLRAQRPEVRAAAGRLVQALDAAAEHTRRPPRGTGRRGRPGR